MGGYARHVPSVYLVGWDDALIIKPGYTGCRRYRKFEIREATTYGVWGGTGARPWREALLTENALGRILRAHCESAFTSAVDAIPYLGARGGGYLECYRAPDRDTYLAMLSRCLLAVPAHMPRTYVRTDALTNNLQDVDESLAVVDAGGEQRMSHASIQPIAANAARPTRSTP